MCHDDYKALVDSVAKKETEKILVRRNEKLNRLNWVLSNPDKVTTDYIKNFLLDFSTGETDKRTAVQLMRSNTDQFLIACKLIDDVDFQSVKIGLSDLPKDIKTDDVVLKIRNSKIRTGRKKKLIRKLKKNSGLEIRFN